jgi:hypothetical protein
LRVNGPALEIPRACVLKHPHNGGLNIKADSQKSQTLLEDDHALTGSDRAELTARDAVACERTA